jgi:hypothetical protein
MTVRNGPAVSRVKFDDLDQALDAVRERVEAIAADPPLEQVKAIRDYDPEQLVKARVELTGKGLLSPPTAGIDIRGDNSLLGFSGGVTRKPLDGETAEQIVDSMRENLQR